MEDRQAGPCVEITSVVANGVFVVAQKPIVELVVKVNVGMKDLITDVGLALETVHALQEGVVADLGFVVAQLLIAKETIVNTNVGELHLPLMNSFVLCSEIITPMMIQI